MLCKDGAIMAGFGSRGGLRLVGVVRKDADLAQAAPCVESRPSPPPRKNELPTTRPTCGVRIDDVERSSENEDSHR
jgi:hypothetical protein